MWCPTSFFHNDCDFRARVWSGAPVWELLLQFEPPTAAPGLCTSRLKATVAQNNSHLIYRVMFADQWGIFSPLSTNTVLQSMWAFELRARRVGHLTKETLEHLFHSSLSYSSPPPWIPVSTQKGPKRAEKKLTVQNNTEWVPSLSEQLSACSLLHVLVFFSISQMPGLCKILHEPSVHVWSRHGNSITVYICVLTLTPMRLIFHILFYYFGQLRIRSTAIAWCLLISFCLQKT